MPADPWPALAETEALRELGGEGIAARTDPGTDDQTLTAWTARRDPMAPARSLEVVLGPEDGRVLVLAPDQTLGRAGGGADHALYADRASDRRLSRTHLRWLGDGEIELLGPARLGEERVEGRVQLRVGDRLALTPATVLWARP